jgi:hypothetical protein
MKTRVSPWPAIQAWRPCQSSKSIGGVASSSCSAKTAKTRRVCSGVSWSGARGSTLLDYTNTLRRHVLRTLGDVELAELEATPELLDRYIAAKREAGLAAKTIANHLRTLSAMFEYARRRRRMTVNPVHLLEPLSVPTPDTPVLQEEEIASLLNAYRVAEAAASPAEAPWWALARRLTTFALGTALRRGEILALRWADVELLERRLHVRRSFVRATELSSVQSSVQRKGASTGALLTFLAGLQGKVPSSPGWTRTNNPPVNSRMLCQLSYRGTVPSGRNCSRG